ncbi:MAG: glycoside hydrolase family 26 protein [Lachnospiraceae bacterium]|nr:glycoside hydrolase family 26 protein [Lachnospiraceae bacterium]
MKAVNKNISDKAQKLLDYLYETAGKKIITGQHTQTIPCEEIAYIREQTGGAEPKLRGFELLAYSPNINYNDASEACLTEVYENRGTLDTALDWARTTDGILSFTFHWFSPIGGRDKSFYTEHTDFDASKVLEEGSAERKAFYHDMDVIAAELKRFKDENIPILWRPFHESDGTWFWWGAKGAVIAMKLYRLMFDYYVNEKRLDNLLWVWNCPLKEAYPGDEYVDVISMDVYLEKYEDTDYREQYERLKEATGGNKVMALAEVGIMPDINILEKSRIPWAYYMTWSKEWIIGEEHNKLNRLKEMYTSSYSIKL